MKNLKLWQKMGLVAAIVTGLTIGGLTPKYNSKGLESKLPTIGMSVAEAKETNPQGYQIPDLTGLTPYQKGFLKGEQNIYVERFATKNGGRIVRFSYDNGKELKIFAYGIDNDGKVDPEDYTIYDNNGDKVYESKYSSDEEMEIPLWVKS